MDIVSKEVLNGLRFIMAVNVCGRQVMYNTFVWGTPGKPANVSLDDYLENLNPGSSLNYFTLSKKNRRFNRTQDKMIKKSPDGSEFDLSLLYVSIRVACEKVAALNDPKWTTESTELEYYITAIKKMRNDASHDQLTITDKQVFEKTDNLREMLVNCVKSSGERYERDQTEVDNEIKQVIDNLDNIMKKTIGMEDLETHCRDEIKELVIGENNKMLKDVFQKFCYVNPVLFMAKDFSLKVNKIFVDIKVKLGKYRGTENYVDYRELLQVVGNTAEPPARPKILVLEGLAGSGKTTLVKFVIDEWINGGQGNLKDLDKYELLLWVQCRDSSIKSYQDLLDQQMPEVSKKFRSFLPRITKLCKILIIIDGLDEVNEISENLVESLLHEFQNSPHSTILCTSRPEKVEMFSFTIPAEYDVTNAEILGIAKQQIPEFVRRTHQEINKQTNNNRCTDMLVKDVMTVSSIHKHLTLPMNLTFLIYILDNTPDKLNMTVTETELYHEIHHMCRKKLMERLVIKYPKIKAMSESDLQYRIKEILKMIYMTQLVCLSHDQLTLNEDTVYQLHSVCNTLELPSDEVFSTFLSPNPIWTWRGVKEQYSAPHKGIQEYYSALHIVTTLKDQQQSSVSAQSCDSTSASATVITPASIRGVLEQTAGTAKVNMVKHENMLRHVAGLIYLFGHFPDDISLEIVDILRESGVKHKEMWLDLIGRTKTTQVTSQAISRLMNIGKNITIEDRSVGKYAALLPHHRPSKIVINLTDDPADQPRLQELLEGLVHHKCRILKLYHHYYHADKTTSSDNILKWIKSRSIMEEFVGCLSGDGVKFLPASVRRLYLAVVNDDHACHLLTQLHDAITAEPSSLPLLKELTYEISAEVSSAAAKAIKPLPRRVYLNVILRGVDDSGVGHVCDLLQELQPTVGYCNVEFPGVRLSETGWRDLVLGLAQRAVKVRGEIKAPESTLLNEPQVEHLMSLTTETLGCTFWDAAHPTEFSKFMSEL
ncbi:hypothetical protein OTU49_007803 [Cherax quadricarinatus]|uniref:NACHT domain-containing protein n=1 Tax=Cherax quadricarinatus TaxID=27406 RepID=A0AAW0WVV6_CHEQU